MCWPSPVLKVMACLVALAASLVPGLGLDFLAAFILPILLIFRFRAKVSNLVNLVFLLCFELSLTQLSKLEARYPKEINSEVKRCRQRLERLDQIFLLCKSLINN